VLFFQSTRNVTRYIFIVGKDNLKWGIMSIKKIFIVMAIMVFPTQLAAAVVDFFSGRITKALAVEVVVAFVSG